MLKDEAFELCKDLGITEVQSYVPWSNIEPRKGHFDFSLYEPLVEKLEKHGLGWVPFLIAGPYYATPKWFLDSDESRFYKCIEHKKECSIQSIWNPSLRPCVETVISGFADRYRMSAALRRMLLGISGNWGESIYPISGGFVADNHMHLGWWCGDGHALESFRGWLQNEYSDIGALNAAWDLSLKGFDTIDFPDIGDAAFKHALQRFWYGFSTLIPASLKSFLKAAILRAIRPESPSRLNEKHQQWLDFIRWYVSSMTDWMEFWLASTRRHFPSLPLLVVTGGDGNPMMGCDFFEQAKAASRYHAGFRVTNLSDRYDESFVWSRPVISACRFYGVPFETEEALLHDEKGIVMRIFDATTSGADGIYFKNLIGYGKDLCTGRYYAPAEPTACGSVFMENRRHLTVEKPLIDTAVFYPNTAIMLDYHVLAVLNGHGVSLRPYVCFDFADENMIIDGCLGHYRFLIITGDFFVPDKVEEKIVRWVEEGGIIVRAGKSVDISKNEKGFIVILKKGRGFFASVGEAICNSAGTYSWQRMTNNEDHTPGVYKAVCESGVFLYNSTGDRVCISTMGKEIVMNPHTIIKEGRSYDLH